MGNFCVRIPHVKNEEGKYVPSKLFNDLLEHTGYNHQKAQEWYAVAHDNVFLREVGNIAEYDENNEITFNSLRKLAELDVKNEDILNTLNRQIGAREREYSDAIGRLNDFNRNSQFNEDFMATITDNGNGKYQLSVVERTPENEVLLHETISNRTLEDRLMYALNKRGIDTQTLEMDRNTKGRYSTENAEKLANGLYGLILINKNLVGKERLKTLSHEAGHAAIGVMGKHPLVQRLIGMLTPEVQQSVLGEEYGSINMGTDAKREVAGELVGQALRRDLPNKNFLQKMVYRVVDALKNIIANLTGNDILQAKLEARRVADQIAYNFMETDEGNVENAIEQQETLYRAVESQNIKDYKHIVNQLNLINHKMNSFFGKKDSLSQTLWKVLSKVEAGKLKSILANPSSFESEVTALDGIALALDSLKELMDNGMEMTQLLQEVVDYDPSYLRDNKVKCAKNLQKVEIFTRHVGIILNTIGTHLNTYKAKDITKLEVVQGIGLTTLNLRELYKEVKDMNDVLLGSLRTKQHALYLNFAEDIVGSKYVQRTSQILFNSKAGFRTNWLERAKDTDADMQISVSEILDRTGSDITLYERYLSSMADSSDIFNQIVDKAVKRMQKEAEDMTLRDRQYLRNLEKRASKAGLNTKNLFERYRDIRYDKNGKRLKSQLSGNIVSERHWGDWELDRKEFIDSKRKEFLGHMTDSEKEAFLEEQRKKGISEKQAEKLLKEEEKRRVDKREKELHELTSYQKSFKWQNFLEPLLNKWHDTDGHSFFNEETQKWEPHKDAYKNEEFESLFETKEQRQIYDEYIAFKKILDSRLFPGSTLNYRAPQFKGRFTQRIKNQDSGSRVGKVRKAWGRMILDTFCEEENDASLWGSEVTYNSDEEMMFTDNLQKEKEKIHRLPLFGINKLKDMTDLSTDLFSSTLSYSAMVNNYQSMNKIVSMLETARDLGRRREIAGVTAEGDSDNTSNTFARFQKYLDKQVFGVSSKRVAFGSIKGRKIVLNKVFGWMSKMGSLWFMGGNVYGGLVNTGTGTFEIFKEAIANRYFSRRAVQSALKEYFFGSNIKEHPEDIIGMNLWKNLIKAGRTFKEDDISLLITHFDILNRNKQNFRNYQHDRTFFTRVYNGLFNECLWYPYKSGDHFMNTIPFLAMMHDTYVYDASGNRVSLRSTYKIDRKRLDKHASIVATAEETDYSKFDPVYQEGTYYVSKKGAEEEAKIRPILDILLKAKEEKRLNKLTAEDFEEEHLEYIKSKFEEMKDESRSVARERDDYRIENPNRLLRTLQQDIKDLRWNEDRVSDFVDKAQAISIRLHGIYNEADKVAMQQNIYGNMLTSMRSYALGMLERRIGRNKYSLTLDDDFEGNFITAAKATAMVFAPGFLIREMNNGKHIKNAWTKLLFSLINPYHHKSRSFLRLQGFSESQIANVRRTVGDLMCLIGLFATVACTGKPPESDDEDNIMMGNIHYIAQRLLWEQAAFNYNIYNEFNTLLSLVPAPVAAMVDIGQMVTQMMGAGVADEEDSRFFYQSSSGTLFKEYDAKGFQHLKRMLPYWRAVYTFNNPYRITANTKWAKEKQGGLFGK